MVSELSTSHSHIEGGDYDMPKRPQIALPGAKLEQDHAAGRYRIAKIYRGQNEGEIYRSPLTEVGVDAHEGDYILAIDGEDLTADKNPYQFQRPSSAAVNTQLERGIAEVMKALEANPKKLPSRPPDPVKTPKRWLGLV